jgi:hypothetical protein
MPLFQHAQSLLYQQGTRSLRKAKVSTIAPETVHTAAYLPHARTVETQTQPLLSNTRNNRPTRF